MKLRVLGAFGSEGIGQRPSAFLVNDQLLVDAGTVAGALTVREQLRVKDALVSHPHLDHVAGLAYLTDTLGCRPDDPGSITVASTEPIVRALRTGVFNDVVWPDFARIPDPARPIVRYRTLFTGAEQRVGELTVIPVEVDHSVPTVGFIVHDGARGLVYSADTGPTEALWAAARAVGGIRAVVLECAFPDRRGELAAVSGHLTPSLVRRELDKLPAGVPVLIFHVKPQFHDETVEELARLDGRVLLLEQDKTYEI
jgi:ribonuclease BN (tRNA processing enzyme)